MKCLVAGQNEILFPFAPICQSILSVATLQMVLSRATEKRVVVRSPFQTSLSKHQKKIFTSATLQEVVIKASEKKIVYNTAIEVIFSAPYQGSHGFPLNKAAGIEPTCGLIIKGGGTVISLLSPAHKFVLDSWS